MSLGFADLGKETTETLKSLKGTKQIKELNKWRSEGAKVMDSKNNSQQSKTAASIASVCRLCFMERDQLEMIFDNDDGYLCRWIEKLTSLKIIDVPNAPASLCSNCKSTLEAFDSFREMCINNDHVFKETFCGDNGKPVKFTVISIKLESDDDQETEVAPAANDEKSSIKNELLAQPEEEEEEENDVSTQYSMDVDKAEMYDEDTSTDNESEDNEHIMVANHNATTALKVTEDTLITEFQDSNLGVISVESTMEDEVAIIGDNAQDFSDVKTVLSDSHKYPCQLCNVPTSKLHILTHKEPTLFQCYICFREFQRYNYISKHVYKWHKDHDSASKIKNRIDIPKANEDLKIQDKDDDPNITSPTDNEVEQSSVSREVMYDDHQCKVCNRSESKKHAMTHKAEGLFECYICAKKFDRFDKCRNHLKWHVESSESSSHYCKICMKIESKLHVMSHKAVGSFICQICMKRFSQIGNLNLHMRWHSMNNKRLQISNNIRPKQQVKEKVAPPMKKPNHDPSAISEESFTMWNEEEHQRKLLTVYGGRYSCKTCKKYVSKLHVLTHKAKELFTCYLCKKKFIKFDGVSRHFHNHVRKQKSELNAKKQKGATACGDNQTEESVASGSKTESSEIGNTSSLTKFYDSDEEDIHLDREFECKICDKYVSQLHAVTHKPEGYQCPVCTSLFNRFDCFSRHVRNHKNKGKFVCDVCNAGFSCTYRLNRHKRQHAK